MNKEARVLIVNELSNKSHRRLIRENENQYDNRRMGKAEGGVEYDGGGKIRREGQEAGIGTGGNCKEGGGQEVGTRRRDGSEVGLGRIGKAQSKSMFNILDRKSLLEQFLRCDKMLATYLLVYSSKPQAILHINRRDCGNIKHGY